MLSLTNVEPGETVDVQVIHNGDQLVVVKKDIRKVAEIALYLKQMAEFAHLRIYFHCAYIRCHTIIISLKYI